MIDAVPASISPHARFDDDTPRPCPLCRLGPQVRIVRLRACDVDSVGQTLADGNERELARVDSLYRAAHFGTPGSSAARHAAHLLARLATRNAYSYVAAFATDTTCVREADEAALAGAFARFSDPGLYPITRLRRARMGFGHLCLTYDLRHDLDTLVAMGGKRVRVRIRDFQIDGQRRRMLSMLLPTGLDDVVEVLMPEHYSCKLDRIQAAGPPAPYEAIVLHDMNGLLLRKWGVHEPRAILFWTSPCGPEGDVSPEVALTGVRIYMPHLRLKVPFLPDVGFDDLREIDLPQPIVRLSYLRGAHPEWLVAKPAGFVGWCGHGPVPDELRGQFPDE